MPKIEDALWDRADKEECDHGLLHYFNDYVMGQTDANPPESTYL
jgi:hypothetical protein